MSSQTPKVLPSAPDVNFLRVPRNAGVNNQTSPQWAQWRPVFRSQLGKDLIHIFGCDTCSWVGQWFPLTLPSLHLIRCLLPNKWTTHDLLGLQVCCTFYPTSCSYLWTASKLPLVKSIQSCLISSCPSMPVWYCESQKMTKLSEQTNSPR